MECVKNNIILTDTFIIYSILAILFLKQDIIPTIRNIHAAVNKFGATE